MPSGHDLVERARKHIDEKYVLGTRVPKDDPNWGGPWDCSEFVSWVVFQEAGVLYGCDDDNGNPHSAHAFTGLWRRDAETRNIQVPIEKAAATVGGILLRYPPNVPGEFGHIVISDGRGGTIEAMGRAFGVRAGKVAGRKWQAGILLPEITYDGASSPVDIHGPSNLFAIDAPNMNPAVIARIQQALKASGFDPGPIDGKFGQSTMRAVGDFQRERGLIIDGEVGDVTAEALGVDLSGAAPVSAPGLVPQTSDIASVSTISNLGGVGAMGPLIPIALQLLPGLFSIIAGDKTGAIKDSISKAIGDITGATDPAAVRQKIASDPALAAQLQLKLAEIAADQEDKRNQAQLAILKTQQDQQLAEIKARQDQDAADRRDQMEGLKATLQDVQDARARAIEATKAGGPEAWAPVVISLIVTLGFFGTFFYLVHFHINPNEGNFQFVNLTLGALVAAFTTVVSFWLGSSQGSRIKDRASVDLQVAQANQTNDLIKSQASTLEKSQATNLEVARQAPTTERIVTTLPGAAAKLSNFRRCVDVVVAQEGGFVDNPNDKGGATNFGVTIGTLSDWRKQRGGAAATVDDVRNLTRDQACEIYRTNYWNVLRCDDLPAGVDLATFDFGVSSGPGNAAKVLQAAVGAASDGSVGSATIAAARALHPQELLNRLMQKRLEFLQQLPDFATFGRGWTNRVNAVEKAATAMVESNPVA